MAERASRPQATRTIATPFGPRAVPKGRPFYRPAFAENKIPMTWECRYCRVAALKVDGEMPRPKKGKPARTHWDMLMERRTVEDLEQVLAERLAALRSEPKK